MSQTLSPSRRDFLIGCTAAASPLITPVTWATGRGEARLVVIVLRGAMDGLDVVQPYGDPDYAALRPSLLGDGGTASDLDGYFALHPALRDLGPLWAAGELAFAHAVSTPYRDKRSHFDGQDILETGAADERALASDGGWLNRLLGLMPGARADTAYAVGRGQMRILSGPAPATSWSPDADLELSPQARLLLAEVYANDPLFAAASAQAFALSEKVMEPTNARQAARATALAEFAADRLNEEARIAAFSLNGWDTHVGQARSIKRALAELSRAVLSLRTRLGGNWQQTTVVAVTEFGRTARENGNRGTDHGTGGAMLLAGGALRRAQVLANWPGLSEAALYQRRDLMPTRDIRAHLAWVLGQSFGVARSDLEHVVFPGVDMGADPRWLA